MVESQNGLMVTLLKKIYFPLFLMLGGLIYGFQQFGLRPPEMVNNYLNDFLCMPLILKLSQLVARFIKSDKRLMIPVPLQITLTALFCLYFEYILPKFNVRYTSDWIDVVLYFLGFLFYTNVENSKTKLI